MTVPTAPERTAKAASTVLITLAAAQFLMTLDSSVLNVSTATVAKDDVDRPRRMHVPGSPHETMAAHTRADHRRGRVRPRRGRHRSGNVGDLQVRRAAEPLDRSRIRCRRLDHRWSAADEEAAFRAGAAQAGSAVAVSRVSRLRYMRQQRGSLGSPRPLQLAS